MTLLYDWTRIIHLLQPDLTMLKTFLIAEFVMAWFSALMSPVLLAGKVSCAQPNYGRSPRCLLVYYNFEYCQTVRGQALGDTYDEHCTLYHAPQHYVHEHNTPSSALGWTSVRSSKSTVDNTMETRTQQDFCLLILGGYLEGTIVVVFQDYRL